jgi:hypothetical protein
MTRLLGTKHDGLGPIVPVLRGRGLRFVLVGHIEKHRTTTVAELARHVATLGYELPGRPSKVISDALRWEVARGRVVRTGRGEYTYGSAPKTTARRIRQFAQHCNTWIVATRRNERPPDTPRATAYRREYPDRPLEDLGRVPWTSLLWLWDT